MSEVPARPIVLVVENDPDHRLMLEIVIESFGCDVVSATSCAEGRAVLEARAIDVLVADYFLDDGSAPELLAGIGPHRPRLAVVMSGFDSPEAVERTLAGGYDAHLVKPTPIERLRDVIERGLGRRPSGIRLSKTYGERFDESDAPTHAPKKKTWTE